MNESRMSQFSKPLSLMDPELSTTNTISAVAWLHTGAPEFKIYWLHLGRILIYIHNRVANILLILSWLQFEIKLMLIFRTTLLKL